MKIFIISLMLIFSSCQNNTSIHKNFEIKPLFSIGGLNPIAPNLYLGSIEDLAVNDKGIIYLLDLDNKKIFKFNNRGKYIAAYSREGEGPGEMIEARKLEIDNKNNIVIGDIGLERFTILDENGIYLKSFNINRLIRDFKIDSQDYFIVEIFEIKNEGNDVLVRTKLNYYDNNFNFLKVIDSTDYYKERLRLKVNGKPRSIRYPYPNKIVWNILPNGYLIVGKIHSSNIKIFNKGKLLNNFTLTIEEQRLQRIHKTDYYKRNIFLHDDGQWKKGAPPNYVKENITFPKYAPFFDAMIIDEVNKRIYFRTLNKQEGLFEYMVFSFDGKFLSKVLLPEKYFNEKTIIKNDALYQWNDGLEDYPTVNKYEYKQKNN